MTINLTHTMSDDHKLDKHHVRWP